MKRLLWFSNCILTNSNCKASGAWLYSMSALLLKSGDIHLINVVVSNSVKEIKHKTDSELFEEYIIPEKDRKRIEDIRSSEFMEFRRLCQSLSPDIVHVWGLENPFSRIVPKLELESKILLEIQGLRYTCADVYYGELSLENIIKCFGIREILFPFRFSLLSQKNKFIKWGREDVEVLKMYKNISTQSEWVRFQIMGLTSARIFKTAMSIRSEFITASSVERLPDEEVCFFCSSSSLFPYKSLQTAIKALGLVVKKYPNAKLFIAGNIKPKRQYFISGYFKYIDRLIDNLGLKKNVSYLGPLNATEIIEIMHKCICSIQTSYVESYSLAVVESLAVGLPVVCSYAGAMPELVNHGENGFFYSPGDYRMCAGYMLKLIEDKQLWNEISNNSTKSIKLKNNPEKVRERQIRIYESLMDKER